MVDDRRRWQEVADAIRDGIRTGRYPVGSLIPSVRHLMTETSTSDNTVTRALRALADEGLVNGEQGVGTRVVGIPGDEALTPGRLLEELRRTVDEQGQELVKLRNRVDRLEGHQPD